MRRNAEKLGITCARIMQIQTKRTNHDVEQAKQNTRVLVEGIGMGYTFVAATTGLPCVRRR
jgi:hypothetical protein